LSILIHAMLIPLAAWLGSVTLHLVVPKPTRREIVVTSTAVRIDRRPIPEPRAHAKPPAMPPQPRTLPQVVRRPQPPAARPHELARELPSAAPQPTPLRVERKRQSTLAQQIAEQERAFSQEVAQLRARDNPLSLATKAPEPAAAFHRTYFDVPGHRNVDAVQVQLIPLRRWYTAAAVCCNVRYVAQYVHGGNEEGVIPWPVCYPADDDKIARPAYVHNVPIPVPPPDYVLPAGTYLTPLLANIYANRASDKN
jgi:hypothetical protein